MTVRIIVTVLRVAKLITCKQHRNTLRKKQHSQRVFLLPHPKPQNLLFACRPFHTAVPAVIVIGTVPILLSVRLIVLIIIAHEILQRKAVMRCHIVDDCTALRISAQSHRKCAGLLTIAP